jgi:ferredoxin-NADP reductase/bacterioferritin-associated ferredoxin
MSVRPNASPGSSPDGGLRPPRLPLTLDSSESLRAEEIGEGRAFVADAGDRNLLHRFEIRPLPSQRSLHRFIDPSRELYREIELSEGRIVAARFRGPNPELERLEQWARIGRSVHPHEIENFQITGFLRRSESQSPAICQCLGLSLNDLEELLGDRCPDLSTLMRRTGAGTVCGSCRGDLRALCGPYDDRACSIEETTQIGVGTYRVRLRPDNGGPFTPFQAGQHIVLQARVAGSLVRRSYTLTSADTETRWREITVRREPHGLFSRWITALPRGAGGIQVSPPQGEGAFDRADPAPLILLVAGIGITPALSILESRAISGDSTTLILDHSTRRPPGSGSEQLFNAYADADPGFSYQLRHTPTDGRIHRETVASYHRAHPEARWLVCGPAAYEGLVFGWLSELGVPLARVRLESFHPRRQDGVTTKLGLSRDRVTLSLGLAASALLAASWWQDPLAGSYRAWQTSAVGQWTTGSILLAALGSQWILPVLRIRRSSAPIASWLRLHRRLGAATPLLLLAHGMGPGAGLLGLISAVLLANVLIGVLDRSVMGPRLGTERYLRWWLFPHVGLGILLTILALYHVWLIISHGGP